MSDPFFQEKGKRILLSLGRMDRTYISEISKEIDTTYAHTFNLIKDLEKQGIVSTAKKGRTKYVELTKKGKDLSSLLSDFITVFEGRGKLKVSKKNLSPEEVSITGEKLLKYHEKIESIEREINKKSLGNKGKSKYKRLCGRYRSLISRLRPRDIKDKREKSYLLKKIDDIFHKMEKSA